MYYLGIDPGLSGAFALLENTEVRIVKAFQDVGGVTDLMSFLDCVNFLMHEQQATKCCIEKVGSMPKQGVTSMFTFGQNYGWLLGVLDLGEIPYQTIAPKTWKKEYGLNSEKENSIVVCKRLFPAVDLKRTPKCRTPHDGMAEALLMAEYARRKF